MGAMPESSIFRCSFAIILWRSWIAETSPLDFFRFGLELVECTDYFSDTPFRVFQAPYVGAVVMPGGGSQPRRTFDAWQEWAKQRGAKGLAYVTVLEDGTLGGPVAKNISDGERADLAEVFPEHVECAESD